MRRFRRIHTHECHHRDDAEEGGATNDKLTRSGFHPVNAGVLVNAVDQFACTVNRDEKSSKAKWNNIGEFYKKPDMFGFVGDILKSIEE